MLGRLAGGPARGASTITMQLAALLDPSLAVRSHGRTVRQKLRQMRTALALERRWSKDEILEAYLNRVGFRGELRGVGAAATFVFGKAPHGLDAAESAVLAALLQKPNADPASVAAPRPQCSRAATGAARRRTRSRRPRRVSMDRRRAWSVPSLAPHLGRRLLADRDAPLVSTLDGGAQRVARDALTRALTALHDRNVADGAVLVVDNASGDVLAYVGGSGTLSRARFVDTVRARRQPGSTLKPLLYGLAFERRLLTPASLVEDTPLALAVAGGLYRPRDYDQQFRGLVSARTALASSLNVPAVRTLGLVGGDAFVALLHDLGFAAATEDGDYYGPALALGGVDVTLVELVGAYRMLANGGVWSPLRVTPDADAGTARRVFSAATAYQLTDVLADRESRSTTFGLESALATRFFTAVKTGTSKEMRDNWCLGFSERYTVGVWVGNASGEPMHDVSGVSGAAPVWLEVMNWLHRVDAERRAATAGGARRGDRRVSRTASSRRVASGSRRAPSPAHAGSRAATRASWRPSTGRSWRSIPTSRATGSACRSRSRARRRASAGASTTSDLGPANGLTLWEPTGGTHTVALVDDELRALATATVEVRGRYR